jgi:inosose dehydratase
MAANRNIALALDLVDLDHQEPNRNRRESRYFWDELFTLVPAAGFQAVELPYQPKWDFGGRSGVPLTPYAVTTKYGSIAGFRETLRAKGILRVAAVTFSPVLFAAAPFDGYFGAFGHFGPEALRFASELGADRLVVTPTPPVGLLESMHGDAATWSGEFLKRTAAVLAPIARDARSAGLRLVLKGEFWSLLRGDRLDAFAAGLDGSLVDVDTAHVRIGGQDPVARIRTLAGRIGTVHLTDTAFVDAGTDWRGVNPEFPAGRATQVFRDLGHGDVDLAGALAALDETGYDGTVVCSCRQTRDICRAMLRTRVFLDGVAAKG